jgi:hypothetical protein
VFGLRRFFRRFAIPRQASLFRVEARDPDGRLVILEQVASSGRGSGPSWHVLLPWLFANGFDAVLITRVFVGSNGPGSIAVGGSALSPAKSGPGLGDTAPTGPSEKRSGGSGASSSGTSVGF